MSRIAEQAQQREANLTSTQMREAIPKIDRRIADLNEFDVNTISNRSDPRIKVLETKLENLLALIFGTDTVEYQRYAPKITQLDRTPFRLSPSIEMVREGLRTGVATSRAQLEAIKSGFLEELSDAGETPVGKTIRAYEGLELHPAIERAASQLFRDGHYSNAVEDAVKELNALVRLKSGIEDKDGTQLMEHVFSPKDPVLKFNSLADQSDKDEQKGFMMMFSGAVAGLRNPRAHKIIKDEPEKALEFVAFISLLAKLVDASNK